MAGLNDIGGGTRVRAVVVMGVSGSGKTTVGAMLAARLGWPFADADDFHPPANVAKMRAGIPLDDSDRGPWLAAVAAHIAQWRGAGTGGVVACSALKRRYRDILIAGHDDVRLVYLSGDRDTIAARMARRLGHYMPVGLLDSQFAALEPPGPDERPLVAGIGDPPEDIAGRLAALLAPQPAMLAEGRR